MQKIINNFWNGKITLWRSYWLVGELLNALFILVVFNIEIYLFEINSYFMNKVITNQFLQISR